MKRPYQLSVSKKDEGGRHREEYGGTSGRVQNPAEGRDLESRPSRNPWYGLMTGKGGGLKRGSPGGKWTVPKGLSCYESVCRVKPPFDPEVD